MTETTVDPFAADPIQRDQYDRPKIHPIKRGRPDLKSTVPYTRVSTFAGWLGDGGEGLRKWSLWHAALGFGRNPELAAMAGVFGPTVDDLSRHDKKALDAIIEQAHARSGGNGKADYGTAIHAMTEPGRDPFVPDEYAPDVRSYFEATRTAGLEPVLTEAFVVNDDVKAAGTFDHCYEVTKPVDFGNGLILPPGYRLLGDKKTGKIHLDAVSIQLATYANGFLYDGVTGERTEIGCSKDYGVLVHIPKGAGKTELYLIDLKIGYAAAKLAVKANEHRTRKDIGQPFPVAAVSQVVELPVEPVAEPVVEKVQAAPEVDLPPWDEPAAEPKRDIAAECAAREALIAAQLAEAKRFETELAEKQAAAAAKVVADREAAEQARIVQKAQAAAAKAVAAERAEAEMTAAENVVVEVLGAAPLVSIEDQIAAASNRDELAAIWRANQAPHVPAGTWTAAHTAAMRARDAQTKTAA